LQLCGKLSSITVLAESGKISVPRFSSFFLFLLHTRNQGFWEIFLGLGKVNRRLGNTGNIQVPLYILNMRLPGLANSKLISSTMGEEMTFLLSLISMALAAAEELPAAAEMALRNSSRWY
jgi:hypothetical protein